MAILLVLALTALVVFTFLSVTVRRLLYVSAPNEALVFAGRKRLVGARELGYYIVRGGRAFRVPLLERVLRLDVTMFTIDVSVQAAYSKGGIPLNVVGVANFKVAGEEPLVNNAVERFLGRSRPEIMRIARETLEGNLRGVLSQLTPEQVNEDKVRFAQTLIEEAEHDMGRMGLALDTLKIQNVSDDVGYLQSTGRMRGASVRQGAAIAEAQAQADAAVQKAANTSGAEVAKIDADLQIARQQYKKRIANATTKRAAMIAESEGQVFAQIAQVKAEIQRQGARALQVQRQLDADVIQPAEAERKAAEEKARGEAAFLVEKGKAQASALHALVEQYKKAGRGAREVLVLQKLLPFVEAISGAQRTLVAQKVTFLPQAGPPRVPRADGADDGAQSDAAQGNADWAARAIANAEQLRAATGIDLAAVARRLTGGSEPRSLDDVDVLLDSNRTERSEVGGSRVT
jgi:flotillin